MRVMAGRPIGEFGHLQRAEPNRAGVLQALQRRSCGGGDKITADLRAAGHHLAGVIIHVLVRQRHTMQHTTAAALRQRPVGVIGGGQRGFGLDRHERVEAGLPLLDAIQAGLGNFAG